MSFTSFETPARPLPGAFFKTPAPAPPQFSLHTTQQQPHSGSQSSGLTMAAQTGAVTAQSRQADRQHQSTVIERARRTIGDILMRDASFPDLDRYVKQGVSSNYDLPNAKDSSWAPYEKTRMYDIPDSIFEQYNQAQVATSMGLFSELNHAWISIDNALYLWDYTSPSPELHGFEEQDNTITAVKLVVPRKDVFVKEITHVLVVATTVEILLLGVAASANPAGGTLVTLYKTGMSLHLGGLTVRVIAGSQDTGRIFFAGHEDNDIYELTYQQEEKWFASRCAKVNHTSKGYSYLVPTIVRKRSTEHVTDIIIDDTRKLLYTLSNLSSIRLFYMETPTTLQAVLEKRRQECLQDISHMGTQSGLLGDKMRIISIYPISAKESQRIHLVATTSTGCRLFLSATRGYGYLGQGAPKSMQVQHVRFPPRDSKLPLPQGSTQSGFNDDQPIETESRSLVWTRLGVRYAPGFCLSFVTKEGQETVDSLFLSAPDTGRVAMMAREQPGQALNYPEQGNWMDLGSRAEDVGLVTKPFAAASGPLGFGNELAVQLDEPVTEIAILTNTGVHTIRRRRFIDIFAAAIRQQSGDEGSEGELKRFIRRYGRSETIASALAVACGQATDVSVGESRTARILDPTTLEIARRIFIEQGGTPKLVDNAVLDGTTQPVDNTHPSSRHDAIAIYVARSVRAIWKLPVVVQKEDKKAFKILSSVSATKLQAVQDNLSRLLDFLISNRNFIEGLSGPDSLQRVTSRSEEVALQGEHQALHSLQKLIVSIIEGISFVSMLFDERVEDIWTALDQEVRGQLQNLTYEKLFASNEGKDIAKVLVKAIVNRNIANGSNVDTVAEALRRRCGSFCSADDVIVFKAQEQLKKASEVGGSTDIGRNLLNESLRLLGQVAGSLSHENLTNAIEQFIKLGFYAGAIQLCLEVAEQSDKGHRALAWFNDGKPDGDPRKPAFESRKKCYDLVHQILLAVDEVSSRITSNNDHHFSLIETKRLEAYSIVNTSRDEVFHYDLYDWYLEHGWTDRLLAGQSEFVVSYLQRLSSTHLDHADLLWRYYANHEQYLEAATVQLQLAKSDFPIQLSKRVEYLSRAKANASANTTGVGRQARQVLHHEVSELLEVANIQEDIFQRLKSDERLPAEKKPEIVAALDGQILGLTDLYNLYADQADYYDICLLIYQAADHRNPADIMSTWQNLLDDIEENINRQGSDAMQQPYEAVGETLRSLANRLNLSETIFPPNSLIPLVEKWVFEKQRDRGARAWVAELFIEIGVPYESIITALEAMIYADEAPFRGANKNIIAYHMLYTIEAWYQYCVRTNTRLFGGDANPRAVVQKLVMLTQNGLKQDEILAAHDLRRRIERATR